ALASDLQADEGPAGDDDPALLHRGDEGALVEAGRVVVRDGDEVPRHAGLVVAQLVRVAVAGGGEAVAGVEQRVPVAQTLLDLVDARVVIAVEDLDGV